jgi:hypothetical protein
MEKKPAFNAALFKNERKETEFQPDFNGPGSISREDFMAIADAITGGTAQLTEDGQIKVRVAGWLKKSQGGKDYISLSLQLDDYVPGNKPAAPAASSTSRGDFF